MTETKQTEKCRLVKDQAGKGRGVVAACDIKKGEIIAKYSSNPETKTDLYSSLRNYEYGFKTESGRIYLGNSKGSGMACFINDFIDADDVKNLYEKCNTIWKVEKWVKRYGRDLKNYNATLAEKDGSGDARAGDARAAYAVAVRDIKAGSDIYVHYGARYWVDLATVRGTPECRLACSLYRTRCNEFPLIGYLNRIRFFTSGRGTIFNNELVKEAYMPEVDEIVKCLEDWIRVLELEMTPGQLLEKIREN